MAHHVAPNGKIYVDTGFIRAVSRLPGVDIGHMGFGEFYLQASKGRVEFDRMRGKDFPGQEGRSHQFYDSLELGGGTKLAKWVIAQMESKGLSERVASSTVATRVAERWLVAVDLPSEEDGGKPGYDNDFKAGYAAGKKAYKADDQISGVDADKAYKRVSRKHGSWWTDGYTAAIDVARGATGTKYAQIAKKMKLAALAIKYA